MRRPRLGRSAGRPVGRALSARQLAGAAPEPNGARLTGPRRPPPPSNGYGGLRLGTYADLWDSEVTERNPALSFLSPEAVVEIALDDAQKLGVGDGDLVKVGSNGHSVVAAVQIKERVAAGAVFLRHSLANELAGAETVELAKDGSE